MGWEPTTTYVYDDRGRLVSSTLEVEWDDTERDWMLALQHYRSEVLCPGCGLPKAICRAQSTDGAVDVQFERCHVTAALLAMQDKVRTDQHYRPESYMYSVGIRKRS